MAIILARTVLYRHVVDTQSILFSFLKKYFRTRCETQIGSGGRDSRDCKLLIIVGRLRQRRAPTSTASIKPVLKERF
jgi:hypothetical protein